MRHLQLLQKHLIQMFHWDKVQIGKTMSLPHTKPQLHSKGRWKKTAFAAGQPYLRQDGIVGGGLSAFSRMTTRGKFDYDITKNLKLNSGLLFTYTNRRGLPENSNGSILYNALNMSPTMTVFDDLGEYTCRGPW